MGQPSDNLTKIQLPDSISELLAAVRGKVRKYSLFSGLLACLIAAALFFWITTAVDSGWFALQRLELPSGLRSLVLVGMLIGAGWLLLSRILLPLIRRHKDQELALLLEKRFPQFQDRLVTTVEGAQGYPASGPVVDSMLKTTAAAAGDVAASVSSSEVFELRPLKWRGWLAGLLCLSIAGCGVLEPGSLTRWWNAFVRVKDTYHLRTTDLQFKVVAQPGDRRLEFRESADAMLYLHPRGTDFELEMSVPDGKSESGQDWVVPERVRVDVVREDGTRSRTYVSSAAGNTFRFILTRLQETVSIEVLAGDFRTPLPLQVQSVTPPSIDAMQVDCVYPEYTGWNQQRESSVAVLGNEISLPMGTQFNLNAVSNKSLVSARIVTDRFEISGDRTSCKLIPREGFDAEFQASGPLVSEDGSAIAVQFLLSSVEGEESESAAALDASLLKISPNTSLRFFLHDEDDIISVSPETVRVRGIVDRPPVIATRTTGVTNSITRRAIVPVMGTIEDDYGITSARFEFIVDDETAWRRREFRKSVIAGVMEHNLASGDANRPERFDVQPLELSVGQMLSVAVVATDGCTEPNPQTSRSEPVLFRIVSNEELLSLLYTRELNLRQRFEEVIAKLEQVDDDLKFHMDVAARVESGTSEQTDSQDRIALTDCARRSGDSIRTQNNELEAIAMGFEEVVEQLVNNQIPPRLLAENMQKSIVAPMKEVLAAELVSADRTVSRFRVAAGNGKDCSELLDQSASDVQDVVTRLKKILENVRDMAEFHEVLADLNDILKDQQRIQKETSTQQGKNLLD